ncbi:MAG: hypothetical protein QME60_09365 [Verrucomicrobiota bacterium]|nr:hypothetical protein [Verrucomicrobiota bacterium]
MFKRRKTILLPVAILSATLGVAANANALLAETRVGGDHFADAAPRQIETTQAPESQVATILAILMSLTVSAGNVIAGPLKRPLTQTDAAGAPLRQIVGGNERNLYG